MDLLDLRNSCTVPIGAEQVNARRADEKIWRAIRESIGFIHHKNRLFRSQRYPYLAGMTDLAEMAPRPLFGCRWHFDFRQAFHTPESREKYRIYNHISSYSGHPELIAQPRSFLVTTPETMIFAPNQKMAQDVLELLNAFLLLLNGYCAAPIEDLMVQPDLLSRLDVPFHGHLEPRTYGANGVYLACVLARDTWNNSIVRLGLARYYHSTRIYYSHFLDASPSIGDFADFNETNFLLAAYALAITAAYSVVEEFELGPNIPRGQALWTNGQWNPEIQLDLKQRLSGKGFDPNEQLIWLQRGSATAVQGGIGKVGGRPAKWARGRVKDRLVSIVEAIMICHRIRNRVAAHNTKSETKNLSPVDLLNVHNTCRHILLAASGMPLAHILNYRPTALVFQS